MRVVTSWARMRKAGAVDVRGGRFHVDALEPAGAAQLGEPFGIMHVALVDAGGQHALGMTRADASNGHPALGQAVVEERRQRAGFQHDTGEVRAVAGQPFRQRFGIAGGHIPLEDRALRIDHADRRQLVRHIKTGICCHQSPSSSGAPTWRLRT